MKILLLPIVSLLADATVTDASIRNSGAVVTLLLMLFCLVAGIFVWILPGIVANMRHHHNTGAIWAITLLAGWTFIGCVIAFVWAFTNPPPQQQQITINNGNKPLKLGNQFDVEN